MRDRCNSKEPWRRRYYADRGIKVAERWGSFEAFLEDMGECPSGSTLDRIDNDRGYEPGNCRWATPREQANNTRRNRRLTVNGETCSLAEWSRRIGVSKNTIAARLRRGMTPEQAVTVPLDEEQRRRSLFKRSA